MPQGYIPDTRQRLTRATRFFARLEGFALECPRCGKVYTITVRKPVDHWDPFTARFTCTVRLCAKTYVLGIVAWPVAARGATAAPEDQVPSPRQVAQLRKEGGGWWMADDEKRTLKRPQETNLTTEETRPNLEDEE